jgi:hypothetical protein
MNPRTRARFSANFWRGGGERGGAVWNSYANGLSFCEEAGTGVFE